jgi:Fe2+ transport system protein FeoA
MFLSQLKVGQKAKVLSLNNPQKIKKRLENIGLTVGTSVVIIRKAPFGDPLEIKVRDFYLALRKVDADKIQVELL